MSLMRLLLLFLLGLMARRLFLAFRRSQSQERPSAGAERAPEEPRYSDLTEQGIDDADFEEIP